MKPLLDKLKEAFEKSSWKRGYDSESMNVFTIHSCEYGEITIDTHSCGNVCQAYLNVAVSRGFIARNFVSPDDPSKRRLLFNLYGWTLSFLRQFENMKAMMESFGFECHSFHVYEHGDLTIFRESPVYTRKGVCVSSKESTCFIPYTSSPLKALIVYGRSHPDKYMELPQKVRDLVLSNIEIKKECQLEARHEI